MHVVAADIAGQGRLVDIGSAGSDRLATDDNDVVDDDRTGVRQ